jgi:glyoxylase-like metal-dependent hydrolase (beta-lactamase superfamily II)
MTSRRTLLQGAAGLAAFSLPPLARVAFAAAAPRVAPVTDRVAAVSGAGGNVLVLSTGAGKVLVDSGAAASSHALLATLAKLPGGPVRTLFNTHWHSDQIGGNETFGNAGARIIAHEKTRARLATGYYLPASDRYTKPLPAKALPTESFYTHGRTLIGGERIEYGYLLEAHTDGDIYVHFRDANVVAVGCAVSPARDPALDWFGGGWLGGRVDALKRLLELGDEKTRFVPAYGAPVGRAAVQAEHDLMRKLFERMVDLIRKGDGPEDMLAAGVMDGLGRTFEEPLKFVYAAEKGLWAHNKTLSPDIV